MLQNKYSLGKTNKLQKLIAQRYIITEADSTKQCSSVNKVNTSSRHDFCNLLYTKCVITTAVATGGAAMGSAVATGGLPWVVSTGSIIRIKRSRSKIQQFFDRHLGSKSYANKTRLTKISFTLSTGGNHIARFIV